MKVSEALLGVSRLAIETAPFIYYVENHPSYAERMDAIFIIVETESIEIVTSVMTLTETLMKPLQVKDVALVDAYEDLLTHNTRLVPISARIARSAADLRARYNLRTPDALHLATALDTDCDAFLTNDKTLKRVTDFRILVLDDLELDKPHDLERDE